MYRQNTRRHKTAKLPKLLRDELVSLGMMTVKKIVPNLLGKLKPQKGVKKHLQGARNDKRSFHVRGANKPTLKRKAIDGVRPQPLKKFSHRSTSSDEDNSLDDEDLKIARLEKKLGVDKGKKSNVEDDGLEGNCHYFQN